MSKVLHNVLVIKGTVCVGLLAYYVLPPQYRDAVVITANMLWLWRT